MMLIHLHRSPDFLSPSIEVRLIDRDRHEYVEQAIVKHVENAGEMVPALFTMSHDECTQVMDQLWNLGIRPSNGAGDANAFEAVKYHLEDMRKLVFKKD